jgi:flagellar protein FlbD
MIVATRPNHSQFAVNPDLIERIHANPDTTLVLVDGSIFTVTETMAEVIERIAAYRARVIAIAHGIPESVTERVPERSARSSLRPVPEAVDVARPVELDGVRARRLERSLAGRR